MTTYYFPQKLVYDNAKLLKKIAAEELSYWREIALANHDITEADLKYDLRKSSFIPFWIAEAKANQVIEFNDHVFKFQVKEVPYRMDRVNETDPKQVQWDNEASHYTVKLSLEHREGGKAGKSYHFYYSQGSGHKGKFPKAFDLLQSIVADALAGIGTFQEFCSDFGYDSDSRKILKMYRQIRKVTEFFESVLTYGMDLYDLDNLIREEEEKQLNILYPKQKEEPTEEQEEPTKEDYYSTDSILNRWKEEEPTEEN